MFVISMLTLSVQASASLPSSFSRITEDQIADFEIIDQRPSDIRIKFQQIAYRALADARRKKINEVAVELRNEQAEHLKTQEKWIKHQEEQANNIKLVTVESLELLKNIAELERKNRKIELAYDELKAKNVILQARLAPKAVALSSTYRPYFERTVGGMWRFRK